MRIHRNPRHLLGGVLGDHLELAPLLLLNVGRGRVVGCVEAVIVCRREESEMLCSLDHHIQVLVVVPVQGCDGTLVPDPHVHRLRQTPKSFRGPLQVRLRVTDERVVLLCEAPVLVLGVWDPQAGVHSALLQQPLKLLEGHLPFLRGYKEGPLVGLDHRISPPVRSDIHRHLLAIELLLQEGEVPAFKCWPMACTTRDYHRSILRHVLSQEDDWIGYFADTLHT
mmetsp:Transcript_9045/g.18730  ORF Transcript_9045/g.18730 Transcript_9045/m.18730 type:complete len:224 (-) Transcript_9045:239-910(-)